MTAQSRERLAQRRLRRVQKLRSTGEILLAEQDGNDLKLLQSELRYIPIRYFSYAS